MINKWLIPPVYEIPQWFREVIQEYTTNLSRDGAYLAKLLWHRGIRQEQELRLFLDSTIYQPTSAFDFGQEMKRAVNRLQQGWDRGEKVCIWGDFDADGITSTAVLWEGLGEFLTKESQLSFYIPNRLKESHGLNCPGIDRLVKQGVSLIVTCDTGSTNLNEIDYAKKLGIDIIVTDHHTLPENRPSVVAIINPRYFGDSHPLYHLSGVGVAYKLIEALYEKFPNIPQQPLENLLDLVAIGLIADLVELKGDCRYLAQQGIKKLATTSRLGVDKLLELCSKTGDRPMDISFGIAPRINAVSRIYGDANFCVKLLTTKDKQEADKLANQAEEANTNRKELQQKVLQQARKKVEDIDLSTTAVIVLEDNQWQTGVLGLVANAISQEYGRPSILLSTMNDDQGNTQILARGSARSINGIDLYDLVASQKHLLLHFGGHPFAAGLGLPIENLSLFQDGINQRLKQKLDIDKLQPIINVDLVVTVKELTKDLFKELKLIEPCGMGNLAPKFLIKNCWFTEVWNKSLRSRKNKKIKYLVTYFNLCDNTNDSGIKGHWWGHSQNEIIPDKAYDVIVEFDFNKVEKVYQPRIVDLKLSEDKALNYLVSDHKFIAKNNIVSKQSEISHIKFKPNFHQEVWTQLLGIVKFLINNQKTITITQLQEKLQIKKTTLLVALQTLDNLGFPQNNNDNHIRFYRDETRVSPSDYTINLEKFTNLVKEEYVRSLFTKKEEFITLE